MVKITLTRAAGLVLAIVLSGCADSGERVPLPFANVVTDTNLMLPPGTMGRGCEDGAVIGSVCFDPPVHPIGEIHTLSINGYSIALEDSMLENGMLRTEQFGELEFRVSRIDPVTGRTFDILLTEGQIRRIQSWLASEPAGAKLMQDPDAELRLNGLYHARHDGADYYLRFYADGRVVDTHTQGTSAPQQIGAWLSIQGKHRANGRYQVSGRVLRFTTDSPSHSVLYSGRVSDDGLRLRLSRYVGPSGFDADYLFTAVENMR